mgnify:FL=1
MTVDVIRGDALAVLVGMGDETVDAVVTDPPYSSGGAFRSDRGGSAREKYLGGGSAALDRLPEFYGDNRTERGLLAWSSLWLAECWRVTRTGGAIAAFCDWRSLPTFSDALQAGGWSWRGIGVWAKPQAKSRPVLGGLWNDTEYILWGSKGPRAEGECLPGTWTEDNPPPHLWSGVVAPGSTTRLHVTEKPQPILRDLVRFAPPGGVVLDPFAGSGSTGVAALAEGRHAVLVELSAEYVDIIRDRLATIATHGSDLAVVGGSTLFDGETTA